MINKRWKKTLSIMLSTAMVFTMSNTAFAAKADAADDAFIGQSGVEREKEVFPEPIEGEVVGNRPDSVYRGGDF